MLRQLSKRYLPGGPCDTARNLVITTLKLNNSSICKLHDFEPRYMQVVTHARMRGIGHGYFRDRTKHTYM